MVVKNDMVPMNVLMNSCRYQFHKLYDSSACFNLWLEILRNTEIMCRANRFQDSTQSCINFRIRLVDYQRSPMSLDYV
jgi:hypothetical protein